MSASMATIAKSLRSEDTSGTECVQKIQDAYPDAESARSWTLELDSSGGSILHMAVDGTKAEAISHILSVCPDLAKLPNGFGFTPVEWHRERMNLNRSIHALGFFTIDRSNEFKGFGSNDLACLAALTGQEVADLSKLSDEDIRPRRPRTTRRPARLSSAQPCA